MRTVRVGDVATAIRGLSFAASDATFEPSPGLIGCLTTSGVHDPVRWSTARFVPEGLVDARQLLQAGDILVSTANSKPLVGKSVLVDEVPFTCTFGAFVTVLRSGNVVDPGYLRLCMQADEFMIRANDLASQTTNIANLRVSDLLAMEIRLPDELDGQKRFAGQVAQQLGAWQSLRDAAEAQLRRASAMRERAIRDSIGGLSRSVRLGDVVSIQLGKMLSPAAKLGIRPIPYIRNANVQWDRLELDDVSEMDFSEKEERKFNLRDGDVLVCEGGEPGRAAVWHDEIQRCCFQKAVHRLRPIDDQVDPQFLVYRMWLGALDGELSGEHAKSTIAHLPAVRLGELEISLPPITEQRRIAAELRERLATIDQMTRAIDTQLEAIEALPAALLRRAFEEIEAA